MSLVTPYFFIRSFSETPFCLTSTVSSPSSFSSDIFCSLASFSFSCLACFIISDSTVSFFLGIFSSLLDFIITDFLGISSVVDSFFFSSFSSEVSYLSFLNTFQI
jgi:hypothetical protein